MLVESLWYPFRTNSTLRYAFTGGILVMLQLLAVGFPLVLGYMFRVQRQQVNADEAQQIPLSVRGDFDETIYHGLNITAGLFLLVVVPLAGLVVSTVGLRVLQLPPSVTFVLLSVSSLSSLGVILAVYCFPSYLLIYAETGTLTDSLDIRQLLRMAFSVTYVGLQLRLILVSGLYALVGNLVIYISSFLPVLVIVTLPVGAASLFLGLSSAGYLIGQSSEHIQS